MRLRARNAIESPALTLSVVVGVLALAISVPQIATAVDRTAELLAAGQRFQDQGHYPEAESSFQAALEQAEASSEPLIAARSMNRLALVKQIRGNHAAAEGALPQRNGYL